MYTVGNVDDSGKQLIDVTHQAMYNAISQCRPGQFINVIGDAIQQIADQYNYSIVKEFCGHGIGHEFHIPPLIKHYKHVDYSNTVMQAGMIFTIEPIFSEGCNDITILDDKWTVVTNDGSRTAQWEETILITNDGCKVLTKHTEGQYD